METYRDNHLSYIEQMSGDKSLAYKNEFKNEIKKHEGILRDAKLMIDELSDRSKYQKTLENENILVEYKGRHPDGTSDRKYFKVSIKDGGTEYFVKRINRRGRIDRNVNYSVTDEMMEMDQLKDDVVGVKGVRVLEYKMAYNDADMGYCIAHYDPVLEKTYDERIADGTLSPNQMTAKYFKMMSDVTEASVAHARRYADWGHNVGYDDKTDEFVLYDLYLAEGLVDKFQKKIQETK